jgi:hypothetical protein
VPIPPENEIIKIVASIHKTRDIFKKLLGKVEKGIELLCERRLDLISAAGTGE